MTAEVDAWRTWALHGGSPPRRQPSTLADAYRHLARGWRDHGRKMREHETLMRLLTLPAANPQNDSGRLDGRGDQVTDLDTKLDAAGAAIDREEWLDARTQGFGCSDLGALWLILGYVGEDQFDWHEVDATDAKGKPTKKWVSNLYTADRQSGERDYVTPRYLMESAQVMKSTGLPRLIAEKAGLAKPRKQSDAQAEGLHKERALFQQSRLGRFDCQAYYAPDDSAFVSQAWQDRAVRHEPLVIRDAVEPRLLCTVEAWEVTERGLIAWELKTDRLGLRTKPPWGQRLQAIGQAVVTGADAWGIQYGPRWAQTDAPSFPDLPDPVQWGPFAVKDSERQMIRTAIGAGWAMVEAARAAKETRP